MSDICREKHIQIEKQFERNERRLNIHGDRIDIIEQKMIAQEKDTTHLREAINSLNTSIKSLIDKITHLEGKPAKRYEKIVMTVITGSITLLIGYIFGKIF